MQIRSNYLPSSLFIESSAEPGKTVWNKLAMDKRAYIIVGVCWLILAAVAFALYRCFDRNREKSLKNKVIDTIPTSIPLKDSDSAQKESSENTTVQKIIQLQTNKTTAPDIVPAPAEQLIEETPTTPSLNNIIQLTETKAETETETTKGVITTTTQTVLEETSQNVVLDEAPIENTPTASVPNTVEEKKLTADMRRIILQGIDPKNNEMSLQELQDLATKFEDYRKDENQQKILHNTSNERLFINDDFGPFEMKSHKLEIFVRYLVLNNIIHAYDRLGKYLCLYLTPDAPLHTPAREGYSNPPYFDRNRLLAIDTSMKEKTLSIPSIDQYPENARKSMNRILRAIRATLWDTHVIAENPPILVLQHKSHKNSSMMMKEYGPYDNNQAKLKKNYHWYKLQRNYKTGDVLIDDSLSGDKINPFLDDLVERGTIHSWEREDDSMIRLLLHRIGGQPPRIPAMRDKFVITKEKFIANNWLDREKILALFLQEDGSGLGEDESKSLNDLLNKANLRWKHGPIWCYYRWDRDFKKALDKLVEEGFIHSYKIGNELMPGHISPLQVFIKAADHTE